MSTNEWLDGQKEKVGSMGFDESSVECLIGSWRKKATDVYSLFMVASTLPVVLVVPFLKVVSQVHVWMAITAWLLVLIAAISRRASVPRRIMLMVVAVWIYAAIALTREGIFLNFRLPLVNVAMMVLILGGVRFGLAIGCVNIMLMMAAVWGTQAGLLPQSTSQWNDTEALMQ